MIAFIKHVFKLQFLLIVIAILAGVYYEDIIQVLKNKLAFFNCEVALRLGADRFLPRIIVSKCEKERLPPKEKLFSKEELSNFNGENNKPIYLALLGSVYDVSKGAKFYGPDCSYNYFAGRDASVSFITGQFTDYDEEKADDVLTLTPSEILSLANWKTFYDRDYIFKGYLVGRFYDNYGEPTKYYYKFSNILKLAKDSKEANEKLRHKYPDCNVEWSKEKGSHVWCTKNSGGNQRDWVGYPRKLFEIGSDNFRCACLRKIDLDTTEIMVKPYDDCETFAHECYYHVD